MNPYQEQFSSSLNPYQEQYSSTLKASTMKAIDNNYVDVLTFNVSNPTSSEKKHSSIDNPESPDDIDTEMRKDEKYGNTSIISNPLSMTQQNS